MTTNVNRKYVWWLKDETIDFQLKTLGTMETYRGEQHRLLGNKQWSHIDREPKFDGQKKANCVGLPGCKFCKEGHKATIEITGVPIEVDGAEFLTNLRKSQHDTITAEVDRLVMLKLDPFDYIYTLTRTSEPYPANWKMTLSEIVKEKKDWSKEPKPTKKEKEAIAKVIEQDATLDTPSTDEDKITGFSYLLGCPKERAEYLTSIIVDEKKNLKIENKVLEIIKSLDKENVGVQWVSVLKECKKNKIEEDELNEEICSLLDEGLICEPVLGIIKIV